MSTIQKILKYKFSREEIIKLCKLGFTNGCGGKGGLNFSKILRENIRLLKNYCPDNHIAQDVEMICIEHDIEFILLRDKFLGFYRANFNFAKKIFKLLSWGNFFGRISIFLIVFVLLNRYGKKYFEKTKAMILDEIYNEVYSYNIP